MKTRQLYVACIAALMATSSVYAGSSNEKNSHKLSAPDQQRDRVYEVIRATMGHEGARTKPGPAKFTTPGKYPLVISTEGKLPDPMDRTRW